MDFNKISQQVLEHIGGQENLSSAAHCVTRLRLILKNTDNYDKEALEDIDGVKGVFFNSGQLQIVFGSGTVEKVYDAFAKLTGVSQVSLQDVKQEGAKQQNKLQRAFKVFSDIFIPIIPAFVGAAMILGIKSVLTTQGLFGMDGSLADANVMVKDFASFLSIIATTFDFLPLLVMYSACKRFGANPVLGIVVGAIMIHPALANRNDYVLGKAVYDTWNLLGFSVPAVAFQGGVFPAILTAWFLSVVEKFVTKKSPQVLTFILVPTITIILSGLALFLVFGPLGNMIGTGLGAAIDFLYEECGAFGAFVFAALLQPLTVTGTQHAIQGIEANLVASTGFNYIQPLWSVSIIAQGGAAIGMYILAKKKSKDREIAMSSFVPTLCGITEPAIFAVNLKYSIIPFLCGALAAGLGGAFMRVFDVKAIGFALTVLPGMTIVNPPQFMYYVVGNVLAFALAMIFVLVYDKVKGIPKGNR